MNKQYSLYLKGIAISMMVALHLFNPPYLTEGLGNMIYINKTPLINYFIRAFNPVPFFLILSGYGLSVSYKIGEGKNNIIRALKLYLHLWIIYLLFIPIASLVKPDIYPGSLYVFLRNATSWHCSYMGEQWFLLPYILLMLSSQLFIPVFDRIKGCIVFAIVFIIYIITSYIFKTNSVSDLSRNMLSYNLLLSFNMLFSFTLGYLAKRYDWFGRINNFFDRINARTNYIVLGCLLVIFILRCLIAHRVVDPFYSMAFVLFFSVLKISERPATILGYLGLHSMNIWLIHKWISKRLLNDFTYSLHYPVVMFLFVLILSLIVSICVEKLYIIIGQPILNRVKMSLISKEKEQS